MAKDMTNQDIRRYEGGDFAEIDDNYTNRQVQVAIANRAGKAVEKVKEIEDKVEELINNPDVVDIVATYADLQAYDTQHLTDKDIIRVLEDETHDGESTYYRYSKSSDSWTYVGTTGSSGGIIELTTADYNWPTNNPDSIALWLLPTGVYTTDGTLQLRQMSGYSMGSNFSMIIVGEPNGSNNKPVILVRANVTWQTDHPIEYLYVRTDGTAFARRSFLDTEQVANDLTTSYDGKVLDARQGKALKDLIDSLVIKNAGAPTTATVGTVGMLYEDTTNGELYQCTAVTPGTDPDPDTYTWEEVGGSSVNVVQTTGTSQTDVMSQNATTSMVYADPNTKQKVQIGGSASGNYAIAIGAGSVANSNHAVAIGASAEARLQGTVIGYSAKSYGNYDVVIGRNSKGSGTSSSSGNTSSVVIGTDAGTPTALVGDQVLNNTTCVGYGSTGAAASTTLGYQAKSNGSGNQGVSGIAIGHSSTNSGRGGVVIGRNSSVTADGGIALGILSSATTQGEMNIGTSSTSYGYNSSNYRLITGVYDPQSAHDAATKGYVDAIALGSNESYTIATSDWTALSSSAPYTYQATVTATATLTNNSILELINDDAVSFATYGFAIGSVDVANNQMTIYSVGQPSASVTLTVNIK